MKIRSSTVLLAFISIFSLLITPAFAAPSMPTLAHSAEWSLLVSANALSGEKIGEDERETELKNIVQEYENTAPQDGRQGRMEQALVDLHVVTPEQAHAAVEQVNRSIRH